MADARSHTAGRFALDVAGYNVGYLKKFSGLAMEADIVSHDMGPDNIQKKNVANIKWTPGKATASLVLGILGMIIPFLSIVLSILAIVFGTGAKREIDASSGSLGGRGLATAGVILGWVGVVIWAFFLIAVFAL